LLIVAAGRASFEGNKLNANWRWQFEHLAGGSQASTVQVNPKDDDVIGFLVGREQKPTGRVDGKVAGRFAAGRDVVGTAIGGIEKLARRMHFNFGGIIAAFKFLRKGRNCFEAAQRSSARVVAEFGNAPAHFIDDIDEPAVGMKYEMPGAGGWRDLAIGWIVGRQASLGGVELIDEQFVQAEISCERIAVISSQLNLVSVWALLALRIRTVSLVLYD